MENAVQRSHFCQSICQPNKNFHTLWFQTYSPKIFKGRGSVTKIKSQSYYDIADLLSQPMSLSSINYSIGMILEVKVTCSGSRSIQGHIMMMHTFNTLEMTLSGINFLNLVVT